MIYSTALNWGPDLFLTILLFSEGKWVKKPFEGKFRLMGSAARPFCPSEAKGARFQASLSQNGDCPHFVNHARSALKRLFHPLAFTKYKKFISLGQRGQALLLIYAPKKKRIPNRTMTARPDPDAARALIDIDIFL
jgi:hypothetical protein